MVVKKELQREEEEGELIRVMQISRENYKKDAARVTRSWTESSSRRNAKEGMRVRLSAEMTAELPSLPRLSAASPPPFSCYQSPSAAGCGDAAEIRRGESISAASGRHPNLPPPLCKL